MNLVQFEEKPSSAAKCILLYIEQATEVLTKKCAKFIGSNLSLLIYPIIITISSKCSFIN